MASGLSPRQLSRPKSRTWPRASSSAGRGEAKAGGEAAATGRGDKTAACTARRCALLTPVTSVVVDALTKRTNGVSTSVCEGCFLRTLESARAELLQFLCMTSHIGLAPWMAGAEALHVLATDNTAWPAMLYARKQSFVNVTPCQLCSPITYHFLTSWGVFLDTDCYVRTTSA